MLQHLSIQNYALIDSLSIDLDEHLSIITGETGAGKSILLGALGLIAGNRSDSTSLNDKTKKCIVEAVFNIKNYALEDFFSTHELDYDHHTTVRREINPTGNSRAFINDTPVTLSQLKQISALLIDIHSQHETLSLQNNSFQLSIVDAFADNMAALKEYKTNFNAYKLLETELAQLKEKEANAQKESDYLLFLFNELQEANFYVKEQEELESQLTILSYAEDIKSKIASVLLALNESESSLISGLNSVKVSTNELAKFGTELQELSTRINTTFIELKDIASELENVQDTIVFDAAKLELISERLDILYKLQQKHRVTSIAELIAIKEDLDSKLLDFTSLENSIHKITEQLIADKKVLEKLAAALSKKRKVVISPIEKQLQQTLSELGMPNAALKIEQSDLKELTTLGKDNIVFLFSANKGSTVQELNKVASGGELSRLMLSIKSLIANSKQLPTIIFDEIDTGVSGEIANKMGIIMDKMAKTMQVITITHLPQIAAKGSSHLFVYKQEKENKTHSQIKKLNKEERVQEIAKMLSTENPTAAAIKNAKELLMN
jgi:DNA repair protein RecN (Recombination protein N)